MFSSHLKLKKKQKKTVKTNRSSGCHTRFFTLPQIITFAKYGKTFFLRILLVKD